MNISDQFSVPRATEALCVSLDLGSGWIFQWVRRGHLLKPQARQVVFYGILKTETDIFST